MYRAFYDASDKYQQRCHMEKLALNDLIPGDVVLVQSFFVRTFNDGHEAAWTVAFELSAISLLYGLPRVQLPCVDTGFRGEL